MSDDHRARILAAHPEWDAEARLRFDAAYARVRGAYAHLPSDPVMMALTNAEKQRRYRRRQSDDIGVFPVPLRDKFSKIDWLIDCGLIDVKGSRDIKEVGRAFARVIDECYRKNRYR